MRVRPFSPIVPALLLLAFPAAGADVSYYAIIKSQQSVQTNSAAPVLPATNAYVFDALVGLRTNGLVTNAILTPPVSAQETLKLQPGGMIFQFEQRFDTQQALDTTYPTGGNFSLSQYLITIYGVDDGTLTTFLYFGTLSPGSYPATPQISNFSAAQSVDTTTGFTLLWSLAGGQSSDIVQVIVYDAATNALFSSPGPGAANALLGTSNSFLIPPGTLPSGASLTAHLTVGRPASSDTKTYPGAVGAALLGEDVQFPLATRPAPVPPHLTLLARLAKPAQLQFTGETNRNYHLQVTTNFSSWQDLLVTNTPTGTGAFTDTGATNSPRRFYRIQVGP